MNALPDIEATLRMKAILDSWRADYDVRAARAQVCIELVGLRSETQDALLREGEAIRRCYAALTWLASFDPAGSEAA